MKTLPLTLPVFFLLVFSALLVLIMSPSLSNAYADSVVVKPITVGPYDQWKAVPTDSNKVIDVTDNKQTTYLSDSSNNDRQTFNFEKNKIPNNAIIDDITIKANAKKTGTQTTKFSLSIAKKDSSGIVSNDLPSGGIPLTTDWKDYTRRMTTNPFTGLPFTALEIRSWKTNNAELSLGFTQNTAAKEVVVSELSTIINYHLLDTTPPIITPTISGTSGKNGWYTSDVTVSWTITDPESTPTPSSCASTTITSDSIKTITCTATSAGGSSTNSVTIKRDTTAPTIDLNDSNPKYVLLKNITQYKDLATAQDNLSGVDGGVTQSTNIATVGNTGIYSVTETAVDLAGNTKEIVKTIVVVSVELVIEGDRLFFGEPVNVKLINDFAYNDNNIQTIDVLIHSRAKNNPSDTDTKTLTLSRAPGNFGGNYFTNTGNALYVLANGIAPDPNFSPAILVNNDDDVFGTYLIGDGGPNFETDHLRVSFVTESGSLRGVPPLSTDTVRFYESDRYAVGDASTVKVNDPGKAAASSVSVTISSSSGASIPITLVPDVSPNPNGLFTSIKKVTFTTSTDVNLYNINSPAGSTVTATYTKSDGSTSTGTAIILASDTIVLAAGIAPDPTIKSTCINDVDGDGDGLCDKWETVTGVSIPADVSGTAYFLPCTPGNTYAIDPTGATVCPSTGRKDVYAEVDYMLGHKPDPIAVNAVVASFGAAPIRPTPTSTPNGAALHFFVDEQIPHQKLVSTNPNAPNGVGAIKRNYFGFSSDRTGTTTEIQDKLEAKRQFFHYGVVMHSQLEDPNSSGLGETPGNDFIISLGAFTKGVGSVDQQSGTFVHEFGHNFGLKHGGFDNVNCKSNYVSVMNYLFQFNKADGGFVTTRDLSYSKEKFSSINENSLREDIISLPTYNKNTIIGGYSGVSLDPLPTLTNTKIDWNRDKSLDNTSKIYSLNTRYFQGLPECADTSLKIINGSSDYPGLIYNFRGTSAFNNGTVVINQAHLSTSTAGSVPASDTPIILNAVQNAIINEGDTITGTATVTAPDGGTFTGTIDFGDGIIQNIIFQPVEDIGANFAYSHVYVQDGSYSIKVTINSAQNEPNPPVVQTATITVNNILPVVTIDPIGAINAGNSASISGSFIDPGTDTWKVDVNYGDGTSENNLVSANKKFTVSHTYTQGGIYTVTVTIHDDDGTGIQTAQIKVIILASIDVSPANNENGLKLNDEGNTQVALFTTSSLDATKTNLSTIKLAPTNPDAIGYSTGGAILKNSSIKDVNKDGKSDLLCVFATNKIGHNLNTHELALTGQLQNGNSFRGTDAVKVTS